MREEVAAQTTGPDKSSGLDLDSEPVESSPSRTGGETANLDLAARAGSMATRSARESQETLFADPNEGVPIAESVVDHMGLE